MKDLGSTVTASSAAGRASASLSLAGDGDCCQNDASVRPVA